MPALQKISGPPLFRLLSWMSLFAVLALDAAIALRISLGLLYLIPLVYAAFRLPRSEVLAFALVATAGRALFGPTGAAPWGIHTITYRLPSELETAANATIAGIAYLAVAFAIVRLREQDRQIRRLDHQVETDPLTGASNRRALLRALEAQAEAGNEVTVLCLDVDHFKVVNDTHGHDGGDHVLRALADRLQDCVRGPDLVARIGGEEFVVLLPGTSFEGARLIAERIRNAVRNEPIELATGSLYVTISIGCAWGKPDEELLRKADLSMYEAKRAGRDRVCLAA